MGNRRLPYAGISMQDEKGCKNGNGAGCKGIKALGGFRTEGRNLGSRKE